VAIEDGEFLVLVGPSGCGKTTALRMVAGLEQITDGTVEIGGRVVNSLSPKERDIAMVFQNYALYPHLSVADNIGFGLRLRKMPGAEIERRVAWAAKMLDLTPYLDRRPKQLSGGQRQRVAMGRAIVREPAVFLMDEPLSNLDAKLRVQMRGEIARLQYDIGTTTIYVTHDQVEAMTMGHRVAVMNAGLLQQIDTPQRLYDEPTNVFVAGLSADHGTLALNLGGQRLQLGDEAAASHPLLRGYAGRNVVLGVRSEDLHPGASRPELPAVNAQLLNVEALGSETIVYLRLEAESIGFHADEEEKALAGSGEAESIVGAKPNLVASFPPRVMLRLDEQVPVAIDPAHLHFFDVDTGAALR
jgi:multiple sugar transport system ATP-binding protein